jgi:hypothetical protein
MYMQRRYKTCHAVGDVSGHFALQGQLTDVDAACPVGQGERRRAVTRRAWRHLTNAHVHVHVRVLVLYIHRVPASAVQCVMSALVSCATKFLAAAVR